MSDYPKCCGNGDLCYYDDRIRDLQAEVAGWKRAYDVDCSRLIERAEAAEAEVALLKKQRDDAEAWCSNKEDWIARSEAVEAKLRAVAELPKKWMMDSTDPTRHSAAREARKRCSDELEALLKKEQSDE